MLVGWKKIIYYDNWRQWFRRRESCNLSHAISAGGFLLLVVYIGFPETHGNYQQYCIYNTLMHIWWSTVFLLAYEYRASKLRCKWLELNMIQHYDQKQQSGDSCLEKYIGFLNSTILLFFPGAKFLAMAVATIWV